MGKLKNETNQEYAKRMREYRARNPEKSRVYSRDYSRKWRKNNPGYNHQSEWIKKNPEKAKAHDQLQYAVKIGKIKREACAISDCKINETQAHHFDYSVPLSVIWLCRMHHKAVHK